MFLFPTVRGTCVTTFVVSVVGGWLVLSITAAKRNCTPNCVQNSDCKTGYRCTNGLELSQSTITSLQTYCGISQYNVAHCVPLATLRPKARSLGDPHFVMFDGTKYDFHGQCDLVMVRTSEMGSLGVPLTLHARTTIRSSYSYISQSALQIGSDTLEVLTGHHYFNGKLDDELPQLMAGRYPITRSKTTIAKPLSRKNPTLVNETSTFYKIQLDDGDSIDINEYKGMLRVNVQAQLVNSEGMLGGQRKSGFLGRDGETVMTNANAMGMEWQVRNNEPQLFVHDTTRAPQYPEQCTLPTIQGRKLLRKSKCHYEHAKSACKNIQDSDLKQFCIDDILLTGDYDLVHAYSY